MELFNNWFYNGNKNNKHNMIVKDINKKHKYIVTCELCKNDVIYTQTGDELKKDDILYVFKKIHTDSYYDSFYKESGDIILSIDVDKNNKCIGR